MTDRRPCAVVRPVLLVTAAAMLLAGCGQRGDLSLPTPQKTAVPPTAARSADCSQQGNDAAKSPPSNTGCGAPAN